MWGVAATNGVYSCGSEMAQVEGFSNAWMWVEGGRILALGGDEGSYGDTTICSRFTGLQALDRNAILVSLSTEMGTELIDLGGVEVLPGLVDSHTHIVFAAPRHEEFEMRIKGESYEAIAAAGGGILNSARKLQAMDEDLLYEQAAQRLRVMILHGTTAVEIKSGYGLTVDSELKILRVIQRLKSSFDILIKATFLGAHGIPMEYKSDPDSYVDLVVDEMLPKVMAEGLADHIDVFCDRGFFTAEQTDRILKAATAVGLPSKIHANELGLTGGVQVAVANGSWSADHLEHCSEVEVGLLRDSMDEVYGGTVPVGLPGTSYFLGIPYAPGRALIDAGLPFAMATDFNPGSSPIASLQIVWALGCTQMKLLPAEAFCAISRNAARALRSENEVGALAAGQRANFFTTKTPDAIQAIPYFMGQNHCHQVFVNGSLFR
ncbi:imidazolonepropionase [Bacteroidota bacterium]|nr:imidazolonepropionase [Bacteroidota bacterium]